jgi:hypothetical protein
MLFAGEQISALQIGGLVVILSSVLLINLDKYRKTGKEKQKVRPVTKALKIPLNRDVLEAC